METMLGSNQVCCITTVAFIKDKNNRTVKDLNIFTKRHRDPYSVNASCYIFDMFKYSCYYKIELYLQ